MQLGKTASGTMFNLPLKARKLTHTHVVGGTRLGKSKLIENMIIEDISDHRGLCLLDWNGPLYYDLLKWITRFKPARRIVLINPSVGDYVVGFNPFRPLPGLDTTVQVNRRISAVLKTWGDSPNEMPTFSRMAALIFTFAVQMNETLPVAELLLRRENKKLREWLIGQLPENSVARSQWLQLNNYNERDWNTNTLSTQNRLTRFLGSNSVRRFLGLKSGTLDIFKEMQQGSIILVNLGASDSLDKESAAVFGSLFLNELFESAMRFANNPSKQNPDVFFLYLDEFQEYITKDMTGMLDQVLKSGLSLVMAHQHLGQLGEGHWLRRSLTANARNKIVFGGLDFESAKELALDMFLKNINERQVVENYYTLMNHMTKVREKVAGYGSGKGMNQGAFEIPDVYAGTSAGESESNSTWESDVPFHDVRQERVISHRDSWSYEEKVSRYAEALIGQARRCAIARVINTTDKGLGLAEHPEAIRTLLAEDWDTGPDNIRKHELRLYQERGAVSADEADRQIDQDIVRFLGKAGAKSGEVNTERPKVYVRRKKTDKSD